MAMKNLERKGIKKLQGETDQADRRERVIEELVGEPLQNFWNE